MYEFFTYDFASRTPNQGRSGQVTVVFCPDPTFSIDVLQRALADHFDKVLPPDKIILLGTIACKEIFKTILGSETIRESLPAFTKMIRPPVIEAIVLDPDREFYRIHNDGFEPFLLSTSVLQPVLQSGIIHIFQQRGAILESGPGFHYGKPSGHCDKFIRTANALVHGSEIAFIAFSLLQLIAFPLYYVYTDTAAITSVAYAIALLSQQLGHGSRVPIIESFGSHSGVRAFTFHGASQSVVLISSSTTGRLQDALVGEKKLEPMRVLTLFHSGSKLPEGQVLCNLVEHKMEAVQNYPIDTCPLCQQNSTVIQITGDQLLPESPIIRSELLRVDHVPAWLKDFMKDISGKDLVRCQHHPRNSAERIREIHFRLEPIFDGTAGAEQFDKRLNRLMTQVIPASLSRIIHLNDPASEALAKRVENDFRQYLPADKAIEIISAERLCQDPARFESASGTAVVVAGAIVTGRSLMSISQFLRRIQTNGSIHYIVGVGKTGSEKRLKEIQNNVQYGESPGDYDFHIMNKVFIPGDSGSRTTPWDEEGVFLNKLRTHFEANAEYLEIIDRRASTLRGGDRRGLSDDLFWDSTACEEPLRLRKGFTFWHPDYVPDKASQAEVYFTVSAVLHAVREGHTPDTAWIQREHQRVVLSPHNFARFNDGVVQASLLRAARPSELDYRVDERLSKMMVSVMENVLYNMSNDTGEASLEFLLALASGRLRLYSADSQELLHVVQGKDGRRPTVSMLCEFMKAQLVT